ncbi:hypothetical protein WH297_15330 [Ochrobactrum vermis]|uniref:Uncharacterized protein n=1 Tax=Ochrobactrum vermis TaxID=1827297 RepID=A0ABU8PI25_9HYPH|nr:hypothetical protein [Ochrobactrum vermis]PQZ25500.1 hypothetical protein CQZ93_15595 [Ochrobactrum vermis]
MSNSVDIKSETFSGFVGGGYSLLEEGRSRLDEVAGARVWYASTEISFDCGLFDGHSGRDSAAWVDAVAEIRGKYFITNALYFCGWGIVWAGHAKIDRDIAGTLGYLFRDNLSSVAGYSSPLSLKRRAHRVNLMAKQSVRPLNSLRSHLLSTTATLISDAAIHRLIEDTDPY